MPEKERRPPAIGREKYRSTPKSTARLAPPAAPGTAAGRMPARATARRESVFRHIPPAERGAGRSTDGARQRARRPATRATRKSDSPQLLQEFGESLDDLVAPLGQEAPMVKAALHKQ